MWGGDPCPPLSFEFDLVFDFDSCRSGLLPPITSVYARAYTRLHWAIRVSWSQL
jgi:hypothetical protein